MTLSTENLLAFAAASAAIIAIPGPSVLFTIGRALSVGRRSAALTVLGNAAGVYLQVVAVAFGVGALVERSVEVFTVIKLLGAAYLCYLGVQAIRHRRSMAEAFRKRIDPVPPWRAVRDGALVALGNPKTIVFFVVVLPQVTDPAAGWLPGQMLVTGLIFPVLALVLDNVWALAAGTARAWFARSPHRLELVGGAGGLAMIGLGASIAVTGRKD